MTDRGNALQLVMKLIMRTVISFIKKLSNYVHTNYYILLFFILKRSIVAEAM